MSDIAQIDQEHVCCLCDETAYLCEVCGHATCFRCLAEWADCPACVDVCMLCTMLAVEMGTEGLSAEADLEPGDGRDDGVHCIACGELTSRELVEGDAGPGGQGVERQYRCRGCLGVMHVRGRPSLADGLTGCWFLFSSAVQPVEAEQGLRLVSREAVRPDGAEDDPEGEKRLEEGQHGLQGD